MTITLPLLFVLSLFLICYYELFFILVMSLCPASELALGYIFYNERLKAMMVTLTLSAPLPEKKTNPHPQIFTRNYICMKRFLFLATANS